MEDEALDSRGRNLTLGAFGLAVLVIAGLVFNNFRVKQDRIAGMKSADPALQAARVHEMMVGFTNDGAIAEHIYSFSASSLRDARWCPAFIARGVAATVGNVYEPDLKFVHRPDLLVQALARGLNWGDATYFALPALSWQAVAVGDPLYRPFRVPPVSPRTRTACC